MISTERVNRELQRIREVAQSPDLTPAQRRELFAAQQALAWVLEWNAGDVLSPADYVLMAEDGVTDAPEFALPKEAALEM